MTWNYRTDLLSGRHNFQVGGDTFKIALYTNASNINVATTQAYTVDGEVAGTGYSPGGKALTNAGLIAEGPIAYASFQPISWPGAVITVRGALLYNASKGNAAIAMADFGQDVNVLNDTFSLTFALGDADQAPIQMR